MSIASVPDHNQFLLLRKLITCSGGPASLEQLVPRLERIAPAREKVNKRVPRVPGNQHRVRLVQFLGSPDFKYRQAAGSRVPRVKHWQRNQIEAVILKFANPGPFFVSGKFVLVT